MKIDCALLLLAALDAVHGHVGKAPLPSGSGNPIEARNEPLYPANNSTAPPCPTDTSSPLRWIRRHLPSGSVTPEYRQASNPTAPPTSTGTGSYGNPFRLVPSLGKRSDKERRNDPYYAASNSSTPCPTGTSTPTYNAKRAFVTLHPRYSFQKLNLPVNQISDGQIQATVATVVPVSQKSDGQIEGPTSSPSSAILVPTGIRPSSHVYPTYPPYPILNSTSGHPHDSEPTPTAGFTSYHTSKGPGSANSTIAASSTLPLITGRQGAVRMSQSIASLAMAPLVSQISDGQIQVSATVGSATIKVPYSTGSTTLVVPTPVACSISSIASVSGYSVAHSIASTAMASLVSQISDGQVQAPPNTGSVTITLPSYTAKAISIVVPAAVAPSISSIASFSGYNVAQSIASTAMASLVSQIADGQVQASVTKASPAPGTSLVGTPLKASSTSVAHAASQLTDGQVQAPTSKSLASPVTQISDGQIQAPTSKETAHPVTQISDGQVQAPKSKASATPVSQISDGQIQARPTTKTIVATTTTIPISQISDGQIQAPPTSKTTVASVSEKADGQVEAPTGSTSTASSPVSQIPDDQLQLPPSSAPAPSPSPTPATPTPAPAPAPSVETTTLPAPPAPPAQVYTETQTSWYGYPEAPSSTAQSSSSSMTDSTAPTVPPGIASEPMRGEAGKGKNGEGKGQAMFALVVMGVYLTML
ncbi:MAG: hypothetical protein Q9212_005967 [Teloschistes hypoglaucus]